MFVKGSEQSHAIFQACLEFTIAEKVFCILQPDRRQLLSLHRFVLVSTLTDGVDHP
ncbi:Hypothetical protein RG1141_CH15050 [Neorhizobium galegae bv. officinalis bv. officinalis str. HAMBI 1141]|uniref:Uncharacterized protein n=1 Tax=Neorhizobium galegae bv. officinalis bv. officinalis str. HAMBI 1141 TaxID=1028801 RepID=A0A068T5S7_NEOGA|nr:Hypothetical protein RG1141_CH15050 [Neorhizobium galegae bv. officinalis bv. officinalis str. HAMBI 1141]